MPVIEEREIVEIVPSADDVDVSDIDKKLVNKEEVSVNTEPKKITNKKLKRVRFPASEYHALARTGKGTVKGSIYVKDLYGEKVFGSGTRLYLNPKTSYSKQWYKKSYLGGRKLEKADSRLFNYLKFTAADAEGAFAFYGVPSGSYYLIGTVKCAEQCGYENEQSIRIAKKVSIHGNQVIEEDLTRITK
jgi:hypothetical protein